ncbi:glycoside hydrolase family 92 protein [Athelia psychrophila]|uniref:Glycoside hydrolase family 92 protein n=1 Tax=Athelia psychrophila TaxID=1759441 RepID=A0A166F6V1_9AGAM|nr:glycoside hydrolase family 92 protein [Fibularhizoctonia sp. CBS 109695]
MDDSYPGYFSLTLTNNIQMEATQRAAWGSGTGSRSRATPYLCSTSLMICRRRVRANDGHRPSPAEDHDRWTVGIQVIRVPPTLSYRRIRNVDRGHINSAFTRLRACSNALKDTASMQKPRKKVIIRVGVSFVPSEKAYANAESEVGGASVEQVVATSTVLWQEKLNEIEIYVANTLANVTEMFYSSQCRSFSTPNNATDEIRGVFANTTSFYFDSLYSYCSWDTFRTFYPLLCLTSPVEFTQIVDNYVDGGCKNGWIPEWHANYLPSWI